MDLDLSLIVPPLSTRVRMEKSAPTAGDILPFKSRRSKAARIPLNTGAPQSSHGHRESAGPGFACPWDYEHSGVPKNARPAKLVRVKNDGTAVSLASGNEIKMESIEEDEKNGVMMKRSPSQELDDEESIRRLMARRKRSATAEIVSKKCSEPGCTKEFKRPCDLTKHEKAHSRPWKCQEPLCKYHEYGWPTKKELDRHYVEHTTDMSTLTEIQLASHQWAPILTHHTVGSYFKPISPLFEFPVQDVKLSKRRGRSQTLELQDDDPWTPLSKHTILSGSAYSLPTGDDSNAEPSTSSSKESPSGTSEQNAELCEENDPQLSDFDSIDSDPGTYHSLDPVKRALFDKSTRLFWNVYNKITFSDWSVLWGKHATYRGAASSPQGTQKSTSRTSDTRTPSKISSNSASSLLPPKRKNRDDEDEANNDRNPSKRSNTTSVQREGLNLACPFHKYKPWKYNHGIIRFRTCSTTSFDAIFRLKEHLRRVHPRPIHCTRCWLLFADQNSLVSHGQADVACKKNQPVSVEGWTAEMDKKVTKLKDETEPERWERIFRELFGRALTNVPSPYFVPYDLAAANEANLETLLHQEVPRIVIESLSEQVKNMDIPDAARALFDPSASYFQFENLIGNAIREVFTTYRSATTPANNSEAPPTPPTSQSFSVNPSIAGGSSTTQSSTLESTPINSLHSSRDQLGSPAPLLAVIPPESSDFMRGQNNTAQPRVVNRMSLRTWHEQSPPLADEVVPQTSEAASSLFPPNPSNQLQNAEAYIQDSMHHDMTSACGAVMDEYMLDGSGLPLNFEDEAFLDSLSDFFSGAPACS
ncbi:hypothetical protein V493_05534 [Pseudogymnoascus sp. VKM F-4281 (FW-2241)]|nr:hypothetical protein V493_05534 [Pseudogymnoascus sp. VKM F-4281 (FW-2241)]